MHDQHTSRVPSPPDREELLRLAQTRFSPFSEAERKLLLAAPQGDVAWCGPNPKDFDPANNASMSDQWGPERTIRADLIRWLCANREARRRVDPRGLQAHGARIEGSLDLSFVRVPFPLALTCCGLKGETRLRFLRIPTLSLNGSRVRSLNAECARVRGSVSLSFGFCSEGEVQLVGSKIGSNLDCTAGQFRNPSGKALRADRIRIRGSLLLRNAFIAEGEVRLFGMEVGGNVECTDGTFRNPGGSAISADRIAVRGSVFLRNGFLAEGEVRLLGAQIGGNLECNAGVFKNPAGIALNADRISVKGNVLMHDRFVAEGEVILLGAEVGNNLACDGGSFQNPGATALNGDGINIRGFAFFRSDFVAEGEVNLLSAQIGDNLECDGGTFRNPHGIALNAERSSVAGDVLFRNGCTAQGEVRLAHSVVKGSISWTGVRDPHSASLNLAHASAGALVDERPSWPTAGHLELEGFVYQHISSDLSDMKNRLAWLKLQQPFTPQPYRQFAKAMRSAGVDRAALRALFEMEDRLWREERTLTARILRWPLSLVVGYGYYPLRALLGLVLLVLAGWAVYFGAERAGTIVPKEEKAYEFFKIHGDSPGHYEPFSPFVYSLENSLPLVKLGQAEVWQPDPTPGRQGDPLEAHPFSALSSPRFLYGFLRLQILLGWILATLFLAGVTGLVQKD